MAGFSRKILHRKNYSDKYVLVCHNNDFGVAAVNDSVYLLRFYFGKGKNSFFFRDSYL